MEMYTHFVMAMWIEWSDETMFASPGEFPAKAGE